MDGETFRVILLFYLMTIFTVWTAAWWVKYG